jgi:signal transduction histidine kinase
LHSMRERLARVGGRLILSSNPGHGTTLTAVAPRTPSLQQRVASNGADNRHNERR